MICAPFPCPPTAVHEILTLLEVLARDDDTTTATGLPRPWLPGSCPPDLRHQIWHWCEQVVAWINHEYAWRPATMIPACWPEHPHLAQELPVLACLRVYAEQARTPDPLEEWHRYTLPTFLDRAALRLGESTCRTGRHIDWPAAARHDAYLSGPARTARHTAFTTDATHP
jgi:hypothetical protein